MNSNIIIWTVTTTTAPWCEKLEPSARLSVRLAVCSSVCMRCWRGPKPDSQCQRPRYSRGSQTIARPLEMLMMVKTRPLTSRDPTGLILDSDVDRGESW
ncbi:hypothetical protein ElyMa_000293000 [Elysia marginata]|uniref:Uncharacterized protein n=1 Tax=Elysia marginata TaxID=1093978 RepID=A0AAV4F996_9GAST|nr:hypothetical protein ElyMa_000293000 [Elysia marginata]